MKNINPISAGSSSAIINTDGVSLDCRRVVKFHHKWLQIQEPIKLNDSVSKTQEYDISDRVESDPLLALLCLLFEEKAEIPSDRYQLYKEGLELLLKKWDNTRSIEGDRVYKNLSLQQKQDLLSQIALKTFEQGEYFFKDDLQQYIADYLCNLPNALTHPEVLQPVSEAVLKSIGRQHKLLVEQAPGIFSFSDTKFHQYFAAREIVESSEPQTLEDTLKNLLGHISEPRWYEVFLQVVSMLRHSDYLLSLMKQHIDTIVAIDPELQRFLLWLNQKSISDKSGCKPSTFRAFYLEFILDIGTEDPFKDNLTDYYNENLASIDAETCELTSFPFSEQQKLILQQYYDANKLLLDCLHHARYVTRPVRKEIEATLLVPSESSSHNKDAIA